MYIHTPFIFLIAIFCCLCLSNCQKGEEEEIPPLYETQKSVLTTLPEKCFIAHRGTCYWAPEQTEAAMRFARNAGASYLECDLQRTADGYLVLFHDRNMIYKSNIQYIYKDDDPLINHFTLKELLQADLGSWFNRKYPERARSSYQKLGILTLEDLIRIAEGYRIKRDARGNRIYHTEKEKIVMEYVKDEADNGNRPGIYPEIKFPELNDGIIDDLKQELTRLGWYADNASDLKAIHSSVGKVSIGNTSARVIVQTFSEEVLNKLNKTFARPIPYCLLISSMEGEANMSQKEYTKILRKALKGNAVIIAPCIPSNNPDSFKDLLQPWMYDLIRKSGLLIHAYTFDTIDELKRYEDMADGFFCNQIESAINYFSNGGKNNNTNLIYSAKDILTELGY